MSESEVVDMDEEIEEKEDDTFSNSANGSSDEEEADEGKIVELQKQLEASPYSYELHVQLITLCRKLGDLSRLRFAREKMSEIFPLTQELWIDWLTDEKSIYELHGNKEEIVRLFERAIKDYASVSIWLEYVQFSIGMIGDTWVESGLDATRQLFERALTAVGIHVAQGYLIWEAYKEFEKSYLMYMHSKNATEEELDAQEDRVKNIFKRQLSIPLLGMEKAYREFQIEHFTPLEDNSSSSVHYHYHKAYQKLRKIQKFEDSLFRSEAPHYEEYKAYIEFEKQEREPVRVQNLYERAVFDNCLKEELWLDYTTYMDRVVKIQDMSFSVYERAVRNCPWCAQLWVRYARTMERFEQPHENIIRLYETALNMGFSKEEDFKELWLGYLDYMRRRAKQQVDAGTATDFKDIIDVFDRAVSQMEQYFWGSESQYVIVKYWVFFNVKYLNDIPIARQLWKDLIACNHKEEARAWLDYANFEKMYGDLTHYRKALLSALSCVNDWPETFADMLITSEREEGTLESFERTEDKCEAEMRNINRKRMKVKCIKCSGSQPDLRIKTKSPAVLLYKVLTANTKKMEEARNNMKKDDRRGGRASKQQSPQSKNYREENSKPNSEAPVQMDSEGFKIPPPPPDKAAHSCENRLESHSENEHENRKRTNEESDLPEPKKKKVEVHENHGVTVKHDPSKDNRTVFLSNLAFDVEEEKIKEFCISVGEIEEIRLVKDFKGRSKGYCFVVYKSELDAKKALEKDREKLDGRPVLVSPCEDKKSGSSSHSKLKFSTGLEKCKVFVKNIPFSVTEKELEDLFKQHGVLKCVRIVTYRNGHSKGIAYIEYEDEASAANAVLKMDGYTIQNKMISVAISNPPPRREKNEFLGGSFSGYSSSRSSRHESSHSSTSESSQDKPSGSSSRSGSSFGPRGRGRTQLSMLPRALARPAAANKNVPNSSPALQNGQNSDTTVETKPLTNSDFANMLKK